jgi:hypothetical protein
MNSPSIRGPAADDVLGHASDNAPRLGIFQPARTAIPSNVTAGLVSQNWPLTQWEHAS